MGRRWTGILVCILAVLAGLTGLPVTHRAKVMAQQDARGSVDEFNRRFDGACQKMDHPATIAMWAEDGADLIQGLKPMVGKAKIAAWLADLEKQMPGAKMIYCTVDWQDIQIHGDVAYEWGINRQRVEFPPPQKPFEGAGKILLILKRQKGGEWKIAVESWNSLPGKGE